MGITQAAWFAANDAFPDPARLFIVPDHYIFRMLYSQGVALEALGVGTYGQSREAQAAFDARAVWRIFAEHLLFISRDADAAVAGLHFSESVSV